MKKERLDSSRFLHKFRIDWMLTKPNINGSPWEVYTAGRIILPIGSSSKLNIYLRVDKWTKWEKPGEEEISSKPFIMYSRGKKRKWFSETENLYANVRVKSGESLKFLKPTPRRRLIANGNSIPMIEYSWAELSPVSISSSSSRRQIFHWKLDHNSPKQNTSNAV